MADIAQIGFSADTSELAEARAELQGLVPAAGAAERAADRLNKMLAAGSKAAVLSAKADLDKANAVLSAAKASDTGTKADIAAAAAAKRKAQAVYDAAKATRSQIAASQEAAAMARKEAAALDQAAQAAKRHNAQLIDTPAIAANNNRPRINNGMAAQATPGNIAAQFQDIGVTAAMGMNPLLIALQQGTQLSMAMGGGLKSLAAAFALVLGPMQLTVIAIVALVAAAIQFVDWTKVAQTVLNALAGVLPQVAQGVALVGAALTIAFAPAILITFWNVFLTIAAGIVGAVGTIVATVGAIPIAIGLILADLYIFRDEWAQVLGFDLIDVVKNAANFVINSFRAAYSDIEFIFSNLINVVEAAIIGAINSIIRALELILKVGAAVVNSFIDAANTIGELSGLGRGLNRINPELPKINNKPFEELKKASENHKKDIDNIFKEDVIGAAGDYVGKLATRAGAKLKEFSAGLGLDDKKKKGGGKTDTEKFEDIINGAERSIASLQAERDAIGLSEEATARLKYETQLLNEAKQKNIELSPAQREQLLGLANDMAKLEVETKRAKEAFDFAKSATKGFVSDFISGLQSGKSAFESFTNALLNLANKLVDRGLNYIIDKLFEVNSATNSLGGSKGGGIFGSILSLFTGGLGGGFPAAPGIGLFAKGGAFKDGINAHSNSVVSKPTFFAFASGAGVMGEAGPEAIMPLKRGPDGSLGVQMHGAANNNQQIVNQVEIQNTYTISGAISSKEITSQIKATAEQTKEETRNSIIGWLNEYQQNGTL